MNKCFKCNISEKDTNLLEGIFGKDIVNICRKCSYKENIPIIKKINNLQLEKIDKKESVYERLSKVAGIKNPEAHKEKIRNIKKTKLIEKQDFSLRDIVEKKYFKKNNEFNFSSKDKEKIVDNFHWIIMRARRSKKITQEQLAREIKEPESIIKMAEKGILPNNYYDILRKIEIFLKIKLLKENIIESEIISENKEIIFNPIKSKNMTIYDLKRINKKDTSENINEEEFEKELMNDSENENNNEKSVKKKFKNLIFWKKNKKEDQ